MERGYIRIVEVILLLIILVELIMFTSQFVPVNNTPPGNMDVMQRYANDLSDMICGSDHAIAEILSNNLPVVYNELRYTLPPDLKLYLSTKSDQTAGETPNGSYSATSWCAIVRNANTDEITVVVWDDE